MAVTGPAIGPSTGPVTRLTAGPVVAGATARAAANRRRVASSTAQPRPSPITTEAIAANDSPGSRSPRASASAPNAT